MLEYAPQPDTVHSAARTAVMEYVIPDRTDSRWHTYAETGQIYTNNLPLTMVAFEAAATKNPSFDASYLSSRHPETLDLLAELRAHNPELWQQALVIEQETASKFEDSKNASRAKQPDAPLYAQALSEANTAKEVIMNEVFRELEVMSGNNLDPQIALELCY